MTLAALICAYHDTDDAGDGLRATLMLAGRTIVERQARLAVMAGANPVVLLVERLPGPLVAAIDRMRSEGIGVRVARSAKEAAEAVDPGGRLLLVADGLIADEGDYRRFVAMEAPALLTIADRQGDDRFERIDAQTRWAGLALMDGETLRRTAAMLQDWDLQSTLLRLAVQNGARHVALRDGAELHLTVAEHAGDLDEAEARIVDGASAGQQSWVSRYLLSPVERLATGFLMGSSVMPAWLHVGAAALTGLSAYLFSKDWLWAGVLLFLLATPLDGIGDRLAALRLQPKPGRGWWRHLLPALSGAALLALSLSVSGTRGWGCVALALTTLAFLLALHGEVRGRDIPGKALLAEPKGMAWLMLPFAIGGFWATGLATLAAYAAASFFWAQRQVHEAVQTRQD